MTLPTIAQLFREQYRIPLHEVDILLAHILKRDKTFIYGHPEVRLSATQAKQLQQTIQRRARGEPIAYITGHKEFFGLDFLVNRNVLTPRPDTELLVETAAAIAKRHAIIADIGTGSGNIAVSLQSARPDCTVIATDISTAALQVARRNAHRLKSKVTFYRGDVLAALPHRYARRLNVICFNAPYLSKTVAGKKSLAFEPQVALTPKGRPTSLIERLLQNAQEYLAPHGIIVLEIGYNQAAQVKKLCAKYLPGHTTTIKKDLAGFDRVVICK